jgi:hypothetical protein
MARPMSRGLRYKVPIIAFSILVIWFLFPRDNEKLAPLDLSTYVGGSGNGKNTEHELSPDHSSVTHSAATIAQSDPKKTLQEQYHIEYDALER